MRLDAVLEVVADRADVERVLDRAVGALGELELFVDAHHGLGGEGVIGAGGSEDVKPVERGLRLDLLLLALV